MAQIRPFAAIRYSSKFAPHLSNLIAPPYDVLDEAGKRALEHKHPENIVAIDLPHLPPKTVGPDSAYEAAAQRLRRWLECGILERDKKPAFYAYAQTYTQGGRTYNRRGFFGLVKLSPFGQGQVYPHEKTYPEAITDRLKLTRATRVQLSPIFGLFSDEQNQVTSQLFAGLKTAEMTATLDGVRNDLWTVTDAALQTRITQMMADKPVYIADGHHRYTMALQYQKERGELGADHPANYALFVLVAMQDPGLLILPTHRIIGGLKNFDLAALKARLGSNATLMELTASPAEYAGAILPGLPPHTFGILEGKTKKLYELRVTHPDVLQTLEPNQSEAWRSLDVAILQRYLLDEVFAPTFAAGGDLTKGYTADPQAIAAMTDSSKVALLLRPTPLAALEQLGRHGEVMPQKSTYFFPKLATGMVLNPLD